MTLRELMGGAAPEVEIAGLAYDSRRAGPGTLFFCVRGARFDGHDHAPQAVASGAVALVAERPLALGVPEVLVDSARAAMAPAAARFHGDPTRELDVVGITGTNGKTTTAYLVRALLEADGRPCGLLGTVTSVIAGVEHEVQRTTPEALDLQRAFREMADGADRACAMEVSSHALALHRADAVHWAAAVFTNLTQDHLDFHPTMEDYFAAKRRLFAAQPRAAIVNVDDPYGARLAQELEDPVTFGLGGPGADYHASDVRGDRLGSWFTLHGPGLRLEAATRLPGRFNVLNALAAVAAARSVGCRDEVLARGLEEAPGAPGRFQSIDAGQPFAVLVDYAHSPDSLENVLRAARELAEGRVLCVFGCGGDRDRAKRPLMGEIATRLADGVIVTSDNPRSEDPEAIIAEIVAGAGPGAEALVDRRQAIARAVAAASAGDVVVIAGKGHEQGQEFADGRKVPFDDATVARVALGARVASA